MVFKNVCIKKLSALALSVLGLNVLGALIPTNNSFANIAFGEFREPEGNDKSKCCNSYGCFRFGISGKNKKVDIFGFLARVILLETINEDLINSKFSVGGNFLSTNDPLIYSDVFNIVCWKNLAKFNHEKKVDYFSDSISGLNVMLKNPFFASKNNNLKEIFELSEELANKYFGSYYEKRFRFPNTGGFLSEKYSAKVIDLAEKKVTKEFVSYIFNKYEEEIKKAEENIKESLKEENIRKGYTRWANKAAASARLLFSKKEKKQQNLINDRNAYKEYVEGVKKGVENLSMCSKKAKTNLNIFKKYFINNQGSYLERIKKSLGKIKIVSVSLGTCSYPDNENL